MDERSIRSVNGANENKLSNEDAEKLECEIKLKELLDALKSMKNEKSPGLDGFTVGFFNFFLDRFKILYFKVNKLWIPYWISLSVKQKQGVITCLPKPNKSRHYLKNWRPISLLNVVYKLASSAISNRLKTGLDQLINQDQKGFIAGRFTGENVRLINDVLFETKNQDILGMILSIDFEKSI